MWHNGPRGIAQTHHSRPPKMDCANRSTTQETGGTPHPQKEKAHPLLRQQQQEQQQQQQQQQQQRPQQQQRRLPRRRPSSLAPDPRRARTKDFPQQYRTERGAKRKVRVWRCPTMGTAKPPCYGVEDRGYCCCCCSLPSTEFALPSLHRWRIPPHLGRGRSHSALLPPTEMGAWASGSIRQYHQMGVISLVFSSLSHTRSLSLSLCSCVRRCVNADTVAARSASVSEEEEEEPEKGQRSSGGRRGDE